MKARFVALSWTMRQLQVCEISLASRSLGVSGQPDHPRLVAAIDRVREAVKKGAGARLALPLNHAAFPRNAAQLKELGAGYSNCAPTPEARLLRSMQEQCAAQRKLLG